MKKQIITIILILSLINLVSAIYPGETYSINLSNEMDSYTNYFIEGNTSEINVSIKDLEITMQIPADYIPGDFSIVFNGTKKDKVVEYVYVSSGGGGGTRTVYVDRNNTEYIYLDTEYDDLNINITDINQDINQTDISDEPDKVGFWKRFWNWLKRVFYKG